MSFEGAMRDALAATGENLSARMTKWAKQNHPWTNQSGDLERSIEPFNETAGSMVSFGVASPIYYAGYVEAIPGKGVMEITLEHFVPEAKQSLGEVAAATIAEWFDDKNK